MTNLYPNFTTTTENNTDKNADIPAKVRALRDAPLSLLLDMERQIELQAMYWQKMRRKIRKEMRERRVS